MIEIPDSVLTDRLNEHFNKHINCKHIIDLISTKLTDSDKGLLLQLVLCEFTEYSPLAKHDIVKFIPDKYEIEESTYGNVIELTNAGLYTDGHLVGIVTDSDQYSSEFDKYGRKMKVDIIGFDDKEFTIKSTTVTSALIKKLTCKTTKSAFRKKYVSLA